MDDQDEHSQDWESLKAAFAFNESDPVSAHALRVARTLLRESDRGAVLVVAALLDDALESLLRTQFVDEPAVMNQVIEPLFDGPIAALGSLAAKAAMAYALGLINQRTFDDIRQIRRVRNAFAHSSEPVSLDETRIKPLVDGLATNEKMVARGLSLFAADQITDISAHAPAFRLPDGLKPVRIMFLATASAVHGRVEAAILRFSRVTPPATDGHPEPERRA